MRSSDNQIESLKHKIIAVIAGGISSEREISYKSANNVFKALQALGLNSIILDPAEPSFFTTPFDIAFNCLHGKWGEDGCLQGYCELKQIPYTGPGVLATAIGLNKPMFKEIISSFDIPIPSPISQQNPSFPLVVKPKSEGSSIGVSIVKSQSEWDSLIKSNPNILSEDYFCESLVLGTEVTSGVIQIDKKPVVLPILEIQTTNEFYDFDGKYTPGKSKLIVPANIDPQIKVVIEDISLKIYNYFKCKGCIRIDMIIDSDGPKVLEMNTSPGLTSLSDIPAQAAAMGLSFESLVLQLLDSATI